jgi:hypothetical protein
MSEDGLSDGVIIVHRVWGAQMQWQTAVRMPAAGLCAHLNHPVAILLLEPEDRIRVSLDSE